VKIAISGAHGTGKTTLVQELVRARPDWVAVEEPYYLLEAEGHAFSEMPTIEDFEHQLERSIRAIAEADAGAVFDRCPLDLLAYLLAHDDAVRVDEAHWRSEMEAAMGALNLVVFVPIEHPDRIDSGSAEHDELRRRVDAELRELVCDDRLELDVRTIEVVGALEQRVRGVLDCLAHDVAR